MLFFLIGCQDESAYQNQVQQEINNRLKYLQYNDESPFQQFEIPYRQPDYFPVDINYRVTARIERLKERAYQSISTSDGKSQRYLEYARLHFHLNGADHQLLVLKPVGMGSSSVFFLAFADDTSGQTTYGGGRYLDINIGKSDKLVLDFNLSYNPYCAYVPEYSCPLPPADNIMNTSVLAGEKDFKK